MRLSIAIYSRRLIGSKGYGLDLIVPSLFGMILMFSRDICLRDNTAVFRDIALLPGTTSHCENTVSVW